MEANGGVPDISQRETDLHHPSCSRANSLLELAGLDIQEPATFAAYELDPPPPPKLNNRSIVTMDITEQFTNAAQSVFFVGCTYIITC